MIAQDKTDPRVRKATRLAIANTDLLESQAAIGLALGERDVEGWSYDPACIARHCYVTTAVIAYARPFSDNRGNSDADPRLQFSDYEGRGDIGTPVHELAMRLRNKAFAHVEAAVRPSQVLAHSISGTLVIATPKDRPEDELDLNAFGAHVQALLGLIQEHLHALSAELNQETNKLGSPVNIELRDS